ncbi:hypothetical protein PVL29_003221 [Vitis rotundifolia]|uniref:Uncharacterized protein n=1 Tax=Vitis rotundifolia TaxID=103349 RepID=A0AA39ACF3_VITRO|nr:hypothetical protein PVL29_003221 [Vitis rotundifolia]
MGEEGGGGGGGRVVVVVREFDPENDCRRVEEVERRCEVEPNGKSLEGTISTKKVFLIYHVKIVSLRDNFSFI